MVILLVVCFAHGNIVCSFLKSNHMVNTKCSSTKGRPKENSGGGQRNYSITGIHFTNEDYHVDKVQSVIFDLLALKPPWSLCVLLKGSICWSTRLVLKATVNWCWETTAPDWLLNYSPVYHWAEEHSWLRTRCVCMGLDDRLWEKNNTAFTVEREGRRQSCFDPTNPECLSVYLFVCLFV